MKKIKRIVYLIFFYAVLAAISYVAVIGQINGARNILYFFSSAMLTLSCLAVIPSVMRDAANRIQEPIVYTIPVEITHIIDIGFVGFFIWNDWWYVGLSYGIACILLAHSIKTVKEVSQQGIVDKLSATYD